MIAFISSAVSKHANRTHTPKQSVKTYFVLNINGVFALIEKQIVLYARSDEPMCDHNEIILF